MLGIADSVKYVEHEIFVLGVGQAVLQNRGLFNDL